MRFSNALSIMALCLLPACTPAEVADKGAPVEIMYLKVTPFTDMQGWGADKLSEALVPLQKSCTRLMKKEKDDTIGDFAGTAADWQLVCEKMSTLLLATDDEARSFFENNFTAYAVSDDAGTDGLFTGYYEPLLHGSLTQKGKYQIPLYARPDDLVTVNLGDFKESLKGETVTGRIDGQKLVPYFKRADIEAGVLAAQKKEIVWVDSAVDAFFLHIQGSGQVQMEDGTVLRVGYAAQNGHAYLAVGKALIEKGALTKENVSMQSIRAWLDANPSEAASVMNLNASYVFFQPIVGDGPLGAEGVPLTPQRSMAVDRKRIPYGAPLYLDAQAPEGDTRLQRLMIAQDTGGAIKGVVRGDYFWGAGDNAAHMAGLMKSPGRYYILLPKTVVVPAAFKAGAVRIKGFKYN